MVYQKINDSVSDDICLKCFQCFENECRAYSVSHSQKETDHRKKGKPFCENQKAFNAFERYGEKGATN